MLIRNRLYRWFVEIIDSIYTALYVHLLIILRSSLVAAAIFVKALNQGNVCCELAMPD